MEILCFETVDSLPALHHPGLDLLVVSDLHLGLEAAVSYEGNYVPRFQLEEVKEDVKKAREVTGASRILLNGDLKHEFSYTRFSERDEIQDFTGLLEELFEDVIVVEGNHDTFLDEVLGDIELCSTFLEEDVLFVHGDEEIDNEEYETLVVGHEHPALELEDEIGVTEKVDCFLYGEMKNGHDIVVMPAFSKMAGGSAVNVMPQREQLSPVLREEVDIGSLKAVAVDKEAGIFSFPEIRKI